MIRIPREVLDSLSKHLISTYPEEGCGLLVGTINAGVKEVIEAIPVKNVYAGTSGSKRNRYSIDPLEYMRIENEVSNRGQAVLGVFHSHPDAPAVPSAYDKEHAVPTFSYLIVSIRGGKVEEVAAWQIDEVNDRFVQEQLEIT